MDRTKSVSLMAEGRADALESHTEKVGFENSAGVTNQGCRRATVGPRRQELQLELWQAASECPTGRSEGWKPGNSCPFVILVGDFHGTFAVPDAKGAGFTREFEYPQGVSATFSPDGKLFTTRRLPRRGA